MPKKAVTVVSQAQGARANTADDEILYKLEVSDTSALMRLVEQGQLMVMNDIGAPTEKAQAVWRTSIGWVTLRPMLFKKLAPIFRAWLNQASDKHQQATEVDTLLKTTRQVVNDYYAHKARDRRELPTARVIAEAAAKAIADPGKVMFPAELLGSRALPNTVKPSGSKLKIRSTTNQEQVYYDAMPRKQSKDYSPQDNRVGKKLVGAYIDAQEAKRLKTLLRDRGSNIQEFFSDAVTVALKHPTAETEIERRVNKRLSRIRRALVSSLDKK